MVQEALMKQSSTNYMGVHPQLDFGSILKVKNLDLLRIGYCNDDGFPATIVGNSTVNAIRQYSHNHELDAFFGVKANINWKKMPAEGQLPKISTWKT
jgi:hypothetical protein